MADQHAPREAKPAPPRWRTPGEAVRVALHPRHLKRAIATALIVGVILFALNQLDVVLRDGWSATVVGKALLNFVVPFCVATAGILSATKDTAPRGRAGNGDGPGGRA